MALEFVWMVLLGMSRQGEHMRRLAAIDAIPRRPHPTQHAAALIERPPPSPEQPSLSPLSFSSKNDQGQCVTFHDPAHSTL